MNKKLILYVFLFVFNIVIGFFFCDIFHSVKVRNDERVYVPNGETAIKIAEAVWLPIYGEEIYQKLPFTVEYYKKENCWVVVGTMQSNSFGGVPEIKINKNTGEIIYVGHGK